MEDLNKILLDFVDGVAGEKEQKQLFNKLSVDEDLQHRMQNLMKVENAVKDRHNSFSAPASSTIKVFDSLGFKPGRVSIQDKLVGFLGRYYQAGVASIITAALFTGGILLFNNDDSNKVNESQVVVNDINNQPITILLQEAESGSSQVIKDEDNKRDVIKSNNSQENIIPRASISEEQNIVSNDFIPIKINSSKSLIDNSNMISVPRIYSGDVGSELSYNQSVNKSNKWSFEFNVEPMVSVGSNIQPSNMSSLNNLGLTAIYNYSTNWDLGLAFKQETYFQRFRETDEFNRQIMYEQKS